MVLAAVNTVASLFYYLRWLIPAFSGPPGSFAAASEPAGFVRVANVVAGCAAAATLVLGVAGGAVLDIVTGTLAR